MILHVINGEEELKVMTGKYSFQKVSVISLIVDSFRWILSDVALQPGSGE